MKILAIDTATQLCGVAVLDTVTGRSACRRQAVTTHSEMLLSLVSCCLDELQLVPGDLGAVALGAGPGSFTGLRIGCATAKGLCYALSIPLVMVSSLRALAESFVDRGSVLVALDAFRGQVYAQLVPSSVMSPRLKTLLENQPELLVDAAWNPDELARLLVPVASELWLCGGGISRYPQLGFLPQPMTDADQAPDPLVIAQLGLERLASGQVAHLASALPTYVTVSAAEASSPVLVQPCGPETVTWTR